MAKLVPPIAQINKFRPTLEAGERALMDALCSVLDDDWTIYVQPFLNGLKPDIIIFSEHAGLGIFEVKDWNLDNFQVYPDGSWEVYDGRTQRRHASRERCPLRQVERYKDTIMLYELPELKAESVLDNDVYGVVIPFVYFHKHTTDEIHQKIEKLQVEHEHVRVFGKEFLQQKKLKSLLASHHLQQKSRFAEMMQRYQLQNRLRNSLAYPEHGRIDVSDILVELKYGQRDLLVNTPGKRRVIGVAGSGKSLLLARKAVNAAHSGRNVLMVCFNITMVNYLNDIVRRLARFRDKRQERIDRRIYVRHFHRLFPNENELRDDEEVKDVMPFDVILIDEGQDFEREWIELLYTLGTDNAHVMFVEDDRQNIYGKDTRSQPRVPGIYGRPNKLKHTFRINHEVAQLANKLIAMNEQQFESGDMEPVPSSEQMDLLPPPKPVWFNGGRNEMLSTLTSEISRLTNETDSGAYADVVILVCTVEDGWAICDQLDELHLPYICSFESRAENERVRQSRSPEHVKMGLDDLRRGRKKAFWMQTGCIKICTIHSFKGWELKRVFVFNNPTGNPQLDCKTPLLYTAITRTQEYLTVFNTEPTLSQFSEQAANLGLLEYKRPELSDQQVVVVYQ